MPARDPALSQAKPSDEFRFQVTDGGASLKLPTAEIEWTAGDELGVSLLPAHSGGLLPALYLWRRLAVGGWAASATFTTTARRRLRGTRRAGRRAGRVAQGRGMPLLLRSGLRAICWRWKCFPTKTPTPARSISPITVSTGGQSWPGRMEVRYGDEVFAVFQVKE